MSRYIFRRIKTKDLAECSFLVNDTWHFNKYMTIQNAEMMVKYYLELSLFDSNYAQVIEDNGEVIGFILGRLDSKYTLTHKMRNLKIVLHTLIKFFLYISMPLKDKVKFLHAFYEKDKLTSALTKDYDGEVCLFVVDSRYRGKGLGKRLMHNFIQYCRKENAKKIYLETDNQCNRGFYDKYGFTIKNSFIDPVNSIFLNYPSQTYIYELDI